MHGTAWAAHAHWLLGNDDDALATSHEAIRLARSIDRPYSPAVALAYGCITHQMRHDLPELKAAVNELRGLCERYGFAYYREWALILHGWSAGDEAGTDLAQRGIGNLKGYARYMQKAMKARMVIRRLQLFIHETIHHIESMKLAAKYASETTAKVKAILEKKGLTDEVGEAPVLVRNLGRHEITGDLEQRVGCQAVVVKPNGEASRGNADLPVDRSSATTTRMLPAASGG